MAEFLNQLNKIQRQAVTTIDGPVMVIAGPGSGKTRVLTYRIAYMLESGIPPYNILALTFTNKAAREMRERIEKVVGGKAKNVWAGTFHSIFARILRREASKLGYPSSFTIYDTADAKSLIKSIVKEMSLDPKEYKENIILNRISEAKSNLTTPKLYEKNDDLRAADQMNRRPWTFKIYKAYQNALIKNGAMDFDDLLLQMFRLLHENTDGVTEKYRNLFKYLLVDEFQDTNYLQYSILKKLIKYPGSNGNICIVGDDAQSIYAFRGATIENILDFEKDFKQTKTFKLEQNYRSTEHIVEAANEIITNNKKQIKKKIWTDEKDGEKIQIFKNNSDVEEGRKISGAIVEFKNRYRLHNNEIAILYRTNAQSRVFEEQLRRQNIPYKIIGGLSFYQRKEVKDLISYLRLVVNPDDNEALRRIINLPKRSIGNVSFQKLVDFANHLDISYYAAIPKFNISGAAGKSFQKFYSLIELCRNYSTTHDAFQSMQYVYQHSGLHDMLKQDTSLEGVGRVENIGALLDGAKEFVENDEVLVDDDNEDRSLSSYLQNIALITDMDKEEDSDDYVTLMSVHAAKGLEFRAVFIVGLEENLFPSLQSMDSREAIAEERRLFYVAITRAMQHLVLSYASSRYQYGNMRYNDASRFIYEIDPIHFHESYGIKAKDDFDSHESSSSQKFGKTFTIAKRRSNPMANIDLKNFKPAPMHKIAKGQKVLHQKFGYGEVREVDGLNDKRVATIYFDKGTPPEKRIMLKFAKLQIMES